MCVDLGKSAALHGEEYVRAFQSSVPDLSDSRLYKGATGKVVVLGGSLEYTGAPYYAAMAALRGGGELSSVYCAEDAAGSIKGYSPGKTLKSLGQAGSSPTSFYCH